MLNLTQQEKQAVLFLIVVALSGASINFLAKIFTPVRSIACVSPEFGKIDINAADKETLKLLPGVGEKLAVRILDYRRANNGFRRLEDLANVRGFHNSTLEKIRDQVFLGKR